MKTARSRPRSRAGFSLVEVALALGVAAFCLIPLFGLLPIGVNTNLTSFEQTGAVNASLAVVADLRDTVLTTPPVNQSSPVYAVPIPATLPGSATLFVRQDGTISGTVNANADPTRVPHYRGRRYCSSATPGAASSNPNPATTVRVLVTWPALADPTAASAPTRFSGSFETVAALVRN